MTTEQPYVPFSQRTGIEPIPPQLDLGQVSDELRRLVDYYVRLEIEREECYGVSSAYFDGRWKRVSQDFFVLFLKKRASEYENSPYQMRHFVEAIVLRGKIGYLFNFVEFMLQHASVSDECKRDLAQSFVQSRAAYRIVDGLIVAVGVEQQAAAFSNAIDAAEKSESTAARRHLVSSGNALRNGDWAGSVRDSIHAVEAIARKLSPDAKTLSPALAELESRGHLHGSLKSAFSKLYGYSNDEEGVRHALVFNDEAKVDEADALFMLGACASFISYLSVRAQQEN